MRWHVWKDKSPAGGYCASSSRRNLDVMLLAHSALVCVGNEPFTGQIFYKDDNYRAGTKRVLYARIN